MDFGDFIAFILFLVFIFAPLLKRTKKVKIQKTDKTKQSGFDILGKIREALEEAARQAEQNRKTGGSRKSTPPSKGNESPFDRPGEDDIDQTFWDEIDDREDEGFYTERTDAQILEPIEPAREKPIFVSQNKEPHRAMRNRSETMGTKNWGHTRRHRSCARRAEPLPVRPRGLRKAVVWSEILEKPVALRD